MSKNSGVTRIKPTGRSKVTNARLKGQITARALFVDADGRTPWARRYRDLVAQLVEDAGGLENISELKLGLIRRACSIMIECEKLEGDLAEGRAVDIDMLVRHSSHLRRIAEQIGIDKVPSKRAPTIHEIAERIAREKATQK